jgi:hypothetical protein
MKPQEMNDLRRLRALRRPLEPVTVLNIGPSQYPIDAINTRCRGPAYVECIDAPVCQCFRRLLQGGLDVNWRNREAVRRNGKQVDRRLLLILLKMADQIRGR